MTCILYSTLYFLDSLLLMRETIIYSCSLLYNILLHGSTIIYSTTDGHPCRCQLCCCYYRQHCNEYSCASAHEQKTFQGTQLGEHCWVTGYTVSTLVYSPQFFSKEPAPVYTLISQFLAQTLKATLENVIPAGEVAGV